MLKSFFIFTEKEVFEKIIDRLLNQLYNEQWFIIMQILKDYLRKRIKKSALQEFEKKGFQKSSMRVIAKSSGMTVGNLYRYYQNKEHLFKEIVNPAYQEITTFIKEFARQDQSNYNKNKEMNSFIQVFERFLVNVYQIHGIELAILFGGSKGSSLEQAKKNIILLIAQRLRQEAFPRIVKKGIIVQDDYLSLVIATSFIEGITLILAKYKDREKTESLFTQFTYIYFKDLLINPN
jgi:AcrR family transcriptional regulator